jgi:transmembrane sensor
MEKKYDAATLIAKYQNGTANAHERLLVEAYMLIDLEDDTPLPDEKSIQMHTAQIEKNLKAHIGYQERAPQEQSTYIRRLMRSPFARAVAVLTVVVGGTIALIKIRNEGTALPPDAQSVKQVAQISAGGNRAYIKTADGQTIDLNETQNTIRIGKDIAYNDGTVVWSPQNTAQASVMNELHTPKGGNYTIILSDGTRVTLNAWSKLSYPNRFDSDERQVQLEGEAFFEVQQVRQNGKRIPFIVNTKSQQIEVLGTAFNVKDYENEQLAKTTLINGSVRVRLPNKSRSRLLSPGQEAHVYNNVIHTTVVDTSAALDWKNGLIYFNDENLATIMKKIERWYDVDVEFRNVDAQMRFGGTVSKYKNLSDVLRRLELTGDVKFITKGRRIIVTQ